MPKRAVVLFVLFAMTAVIIPLVAYVASASPLAAGCGLFGDLNDDGKIDIYDIIIVANCWHSSGSGCDPCDLDGDGDIDVVDIMLLAAHWGDICPWPGPFGVQTFGELSNSELRSRVQALGLQWARADLSWSSIEGSEPADGVHSYNWSGADALINNMLASGVNPMITIGHSPEWAVQDVLAATGTAYDCGPIDYEDLDAFADFVQALVERYDGDDVDDADGHPVVQYWGFWNEPDNYSTTECLYVGGCWGGDLDSDGMPDPQEYARMLSYAYPAAKAASSEAQVLFGAIAYETAPACFNFNFMDQVLDAFSLYPSADFDMANVHQYDWQRGYWDGDRPFYQGLLGKTVRPDDGGRLSIKTILANHGLSNKPIVVSEVGLATGGSADCRELQAQHLVHEMVRGLSVPDDIKVIIWFTLKDLGDGGGWGLVANDAPDYTPHLAYNAYQTVIQQLTGYDSVRQLPDSETGSTNIQGFVFAKDGVASNKVVLWRDTGKPIKQENTTAESTMAISSAQLGMWTGTVRITDKYGDVTTKSGDSSVSISFTTDPVFVEAD